MRWMALAVLASAGCNQILGLHDTRRSDAAVAADGPPDAMWPALVLDREVLASVGPETIVHGWTSAGMIDPPPAVWVGPVNGQLTAAAISDDGTFHVPPDLIGGAYRIVYQLPGDAPTEIQWSADTGTFSLPLLGRVARGTPPPGAQLHFQPGGAPASLPDVRVLTAGLWTRQLSVGATGPSFDVPYPAGFESPSGPAGSLDAAHGDVEVVTACTTPCTAGGATGYAIMQVDKLVADASVTAPSIWTMPGLTHITTVFSESPLLGRIGSALGGSMSVSVDPTVHWAGVVPTTTLPPFTHDVAGALPETAMLPLYIGLANPMTFANPFDGTHTPAPRLPVAVYGKYTASRTTPGGLVLSSGFEVVDKPDQTEMYDVGIANGVRLGATTLAGQGAADQQMVDLGGGSAVPLVFGADLPVDDCIVTVYQLAPGPTLVPVRHLLVEKTPTAAAPMSIDRSVFASGMDYTLGITCRRGSHDGTDYTKISLPYELSTLYTATFHVP